MDISINILCVDGSNLECKTHDVPFVVKFLSKNDHEGSCVSISLSSDNPDEVYSLLELLGRLEMQTRIRTSLEKP